MVILTFERHTIISLVVHWNWGDKVKVIFCSWTLIDFKLWKKMINWEKLNLDNDKDVSETERILSCELFYSFLHFISYYKKLFEQYISLFASLFFTRDRQRWITYYTEWCFFVLFACEHVEGIIFVVYNFSYYFFHWVFEIDKSLCWIYLK